jgi:hypothetical protein
MEITTSILMDSNDRNSHTIPKAAAKTNEHNLRRMNARLLATFVSKETLNNPNSSVCYEENNATMCERFDRILSHDTTLKK